jgi:hypothetical protein
MVKVALLTSTQAQKTCGVCHPGPPLQTKYGEPAELPISLLMMSST